MNRRGLLGSMAFLSAWPAVKAGAQFYPPPVLPPPRWVSVNVPQIVASANIQQCPQWCWAASLSMIFAFHGHPVDQQRIVAETYGQVACLPAYFTRTLAQDLSRPWIDDRGQPFRSRILAAYDQFNGVMLMNNDIIANELQSNRPLLFCNTHHAMVVCAAEVQATPMGLRIGRVDVVDPWPYSQRIHPLPPAEALAASMGGEMTFLAAVAID